MGACSASDVTDDLPITLKTGWTVPKVQCTESARQEAGERGRGLLAIFSLHAVFGLRETIGQDRPVTPHDRLNVTEATRCSVSVLLLDETATEV